MKLLCAVKRALDRNVKIQVKRDRAIAELRPDSRRDQSAGAIGVGEAHVRNVAS